MSFGVAYLDDNLRPRPTRDPVSYRNLTTVAKGALNPLESAL